MNESKNIILKLVSITYSGDSIGDDIRVEFEILGNVVALQKRIRRGSTITFNTEVLRHASHRLSVKIPITVRVIDRDMVFNDVGVREIILAIDTTPLVSQHTIQIEVRESRGRLFGRSSRVAVFELILEARVEPIRQYVIDQGDGWLAILPHNSSKKISIPAYLTVTVTQVDRFREYFTILEGPHRGQSASVKKNDDGGSFLALENPHTNPAHLFYSISRKTLTLNRKKYQTTDYPTHPWKKGFYDIEIPDAPHRGGLSYRNIQHARTWFRVGHEGDRYIHTGSLSLGCITVTEHNRWEELYATLIRARKGDGMSVGVLEVID